METVHVAMYKLEQCLEGSHVMLHCSMHFRLVAQVEYKVQIHSSELLVLLQVGACDRHLALHGMGSMAAAVCSVATVPLLEEHGWSVG